MSGSRVGAVERKLGGRVRAERLRGQPVMAHGPWVWSAFGRGPRYGGQAGPRPVTTHKVRAALSLASVGLGGGKAAGAAFAHPRAADARSVRGPIFF